MPLPENILIFKTNIQTEADALAVREHIERKTVVALWSIDLHDEDKVMRVLPEGINNKNIIELVQGMGYECTELE